MSFKIDGLDELQKQLKKMEKGARELERTKTVPLEQLLTPTFMRKYSPFSSFDELLAAGNFEVNSQEDFEAIPDDVFNRHIATHTNFSTWDDMLGEATSQYALKKMGL